MPIRMKLAWRVIAVTSDGTGLGDCGHYHVSKEMATRCSWTPVPWPDRCDLLVRQVRDRRGDRPRARSSKR